MKRRVRKNPASRKLYNALAEDLGIDYMQQSNEDLRVGFARAVSTMADVLKRDNPAFDKERFLQATYKRRDLHKHQRGTNKNPPLVTFGNPPKGMLSRNVVDIRYQHVVDGKFYHHKFAKNQVEIRAVPNGKTAIIRRTDGKALTKEY